MMLFWGLRLLQSPVVRLGLLLVGLLGLYSWGYHQGAQETRAKVQKAAEQEVTRQTDAIRQVLQQTEAELQRLDRESKQAAILVQQVKNAARKAGTSRQICLTGKVTDALRSIK